ncbi:MAG: O-antigen ligase family protein [Candidatus Pacebacteria bacterium]|nr:O-antigen ligase family protein [Candidatus Paceibacterota bacterium]
MTTKLKSILHHLDKNILFYLTAFLFVFIPLYPKLPLADIIPGYLVRIRLEDIFVLLTGVIWAIQWFRKKIKWNTFFFWAIVGYLLIGFASIISGIFLNHTIPGQLLHIGKSGLHFFRYAEYFSLFVVAFAGLTDQKQLNVIFKLLIVSLIAITIYGAGQKYLEWPLYSTMNREYAKGQALTLGEGARVQSSFGGHYDMAAYMVITLPIIFAYILYTKSWRAKIFLAIIELGGVWMLVLSGSKTSLIAYGLTHLVIIVNYLRLKKLNFSKLFKYLFGLLITGTILAVTVFTLNKEMATTFLDLSLKIPVAGSVVGKFYTSDTDASKPKDWTSTEPVYEEKIILLDNGEEAIEYTQKVEQWSPNAIKYGISMGIRLDTLWPNAITALRRNLYLGSSYANLNKSALNEFTDSDSTDNNFLRTLGETGLLGFVSFYSIIFLLIITLLKVKAKPLTPAFVYSQALLGGTIGLLFNAIYIDVFSASKIAFTFWLITGLTLKSFYLNQPDLAKQLDKHRSIWIKKFWNKRWPFLLALLVMGLFLWRNPYLEEFTILNKFNFKGDNYQNLVLAKCIVEKNDFSLCRENSSLPVKFAPLYSLMIVPIYNLMSNPNAYFFINYFLFSLTIIFLYGALRKIVKGHWWQLSFLTLFIINPLIREFVMESTSINALMMIAALALYLKILIIPHFKKVYRTFFSSNITLSVVFLGMAFFTYSSFTHHPDPLFTDSSLGGKALSYQTIKRANLTFGRKLKDRPYLITAGNPYHFDLYGNNNYLLLPYTPHQDLFIQAKNVWGEFNLSNGNTFDYSQVTRPTDLHPLYKQVLKTNPLYFTNADSGEFKDLRRDFNTTVIDLECDEQCNFYQLADKTPLGQIFELSIYNQSIFGQTIPELFTQPKEDLSFIVTAHTYPDPTLKENQPLPGQPDRYYAKHLAQRLSSLLEQPSDFIVMLGDLIKEPAKSQYSIFDKYFTSFYTKPFINVANNLDPKRNMPGYQKYTIGDNYFINFRGSDQHTLTKAEKLAFYNSFYELEFSDTDYVFIFSYKNLRYNSDFMDLVMPKLNQLKDKSIYVIAGNKGEKQTYGTDLTQVLNEKKTKTVNDYDNVIFIETGFNEETTPQALKIDISKDGGSTITPIEF